VRTSRLSSRQKRRKSSGREVKAMDQENYQLCSSFLNRCKGREIAFIDARENVEGMKTQHYYHENKRKNTH